MVLPVDNLKEVITDLAEGDLDINIENFWVAGSRETNDLFQELSKIQKLLRFNSDSYFQGEPAISLMNYAESRMYFEEQSNYLGTMICCVEMGEILFEALEYEDAIECYSEAIRL